MKFEILKKEDFTTNRWSGGDTTEFYIYPENRSYKEREFLFRLSRATIEIEKSDFTPLHNVKRKLFLLDGQLELIHENHHSKLLNPLEFDTFSGSWNTKSIGKATDFNLMMKGNTSGHYSCIQTKNKVRVSESLMSDFTFIYVIKGNLNVPGSKLNQGDLVKITKNSYEFPLELEANSKILIIKINL